MTTYKYDGFISYSTRADGDLAPKIQEGLERLAKPWNKRRALKIFQDIDDLAANSDLETTLRGELEQSNTLVYLASEEAAASAWCGDELEHWLATRPSSQLVVVLTGGTLEFDKEREHPTVFERSTSAPAAFAALTTVPLYIDMRMPDRDVELLDHRRDPDFRAKLTKIAAALHSNKTGRQIEPRDIDSADLAEHRTASRLRRIAVTLLVILTAVAVAAGLVANQMRLTADQERRTAEALARSAESRALAASSLSVLERNPELASLLALSADEIDGTAEAAAALRSAAGSSWRATVPESGEPVSSVALDASAGSILVARGAGGVVLRDLTTGTDVQNFPGTAGVAAMSPDGDLVVTADQTSAIVWNRDGTERNRLPAQGITSIEFSPDGTNLLVAGSEGVALWHPEGGEPRFLTSGYAVGASFDPAATRVVTFGPEYSDPIVVEVDSPEVVLVLSADDADEFDSIDRVTSARFDRDGERIVTAKGVNVRVWDSSGRRLSTFNSGTAVRNQAGTVLNSVEAVAFDHRGRVVSAGFDGTVVWNPTDGSRHELSTEAVTSIAVSGDGVSIATVGLGNESVPAGVRVWNVDGFALAELAVDGYLSEQGEVTADVSADGTRFSSVARANRLGEVRVWDADGTLLVQENSPEGQTSVLNADGSRLVVDDGQFGVTVSSVDDQSLRQTLTVEQSGAPAFDSAGKVLAVPTFDGLELWDVAGVEPARTGVIEPIRSVRLAALDDAGNRVATSSDVEGVVIWAMNGDRVAELDPGGVVDLAFDPSGELLATAGANGVRVWDLQGSGRPVRIVAEYTSSVDFSADGRHVVTANSLGVVVWDLDGNRVSTLTSAPSTSAEFDRNGSIVVTGGEDGVDVWRWMAESDLAPELRGRLGDRTFTSEECERYLIDPCPAGS